MNKFLIPENCNISIKNILSSSFGRGFTPSMHNMFVECALSPEGALFPTNNRIISLPELEDPNYRVYDFFQLLRWAYVKDMLLRLSPTQYYRVECMNAFSALYEYLPVSIYRQFVTSLHLDRNSVYRFLKKDGSLFWAIFMGVGRGDDCYSFRSFLVKSGNTFNEMRLSSFHEYMAHRVSYNDKAYYNIPFSHNASGHFPTQRLVAFEKVPSLFSDMLFIHRLNLGKTPLSGSLALGLEGVGNIEPITDTDNLYGFSLCPLTGHKHTEYPGWEIANRAEDYMRQEIMWLLSSSGRKDVTITF